MRTISQLAEARTISCGYASREYAESLAEFGQVRPLPTCGGWLLESPIAGSKCRDGMGCYPLFSCRDWQGLGSDLDALADELVSVRIVTDPFADISHARLKQAFPDACYEYKQHFVTDLTRPLDSIVASHHRRNARKALEAVSVRESTSDPDLLGTWQSLYGNLIQRHAISGIARFSAASFERQVRVPGFAAFSAMVEDQTCGMTLWYVQGDVVYYHLAAYSEQGYKLGASFALFWTALQHFAERGIRWAALGAGAGTAAAESGLTRFKRGWATSTRPAYFCGRILKPGVYALLAARVASETASTYFPIYRAA